jgi:hypothetical protein
LTNDELGAVFAELDASVELVDFVISLLGITYVFTLGLVVTLRFFARLLLVVRELFAYFNFSVVVPKDNKSFSTSDSKDRCYRADCNSRNTGSNTEKSSDSFLLV